MLLPEAQRLAESLIAKHLTCSGWEFKWNDSTIALGLCRYRTTTIELSTRWTIGLPESEVRDTILHEIAHAMAGPEAKHGFKWQQAAIFVGAKPEATAKNLDIARRDIAEPTHLLVAPDGKVLKNYYRTPSYRVYANIKNMYLPSNKAGTLGLLKIVLNTKTSLMEL